MGNVSREFEKVTEVVSPGLYFFASDMTNRQPNKIVPNIGLSVTDVIGDERPKWEYTALRHIKGAFPDLVALEWYPSSEPGVWENDEVEWLMQNGSVRLDEEYYRIFVQSLGDDSSEREKLRIADEKRQILEGGVCSVDADYERDGLLELETFGYPNKEQRVFMGGRNLYARAPYWRGRLELKGINLGRLIVAVVDHLNASIADRDIPVWRVIETST